jgi:dephospho-CoA kinase
MKRILLTGMSGTGKSTVIAELAARGHKAIDLDSDDWSEWVKVSDDPNPSVSEVDPASIWHRKDWVWREDRLQDLLSIEDADVLFISGTSQNQGKFYPQLNHVVLLSAPTQVIMERLATRTTNSYGKHPDELSRVLEHKETVEPLLRRGASLEIDTRASLDGVVETILTLARR